MSEESIKKGKKMCRENVSVCMACYNGEAYIKEQIDSILRQLVSGDELIIVDDGSTDGTAAVISKFNAQL